SVFGAFTAILARVRAVPGAARAAGPQPAMTGAATSIGSTSATLNGTVSPNKQSTTVSFQYGTTTAYGATAAAGTVNGNAAKSVSASISGLAPSTVYHFRVTATNSSGQRIGQDMTFTTAASGPPPTTKNSVGITAVPGTVTYGHSTVISGKVTGPKGGGVPVVLEAQPYPFTAQINATGEVLSTGTNGNYSM